MSLVVAGQTTTEEIDDYVDRWHADPSGVSLHEYLGMRRDEYALWLSSPDMLPFMVARRRQNDLLGDMSLRTHQAASLN
jgi:hypothetical protein